MFAYCANDPIVCVDDAGESFAVVIGFNYNLFGWGFIGSVNIVSTKEDFGIQYSYYTPGDPELSKKNNRTIGVDLGSYVGIQYTEKTNMKQLEGLAKATGGDLFFGADLLTEENGRYLGWQFGASNYSYNMHSLYTDTKTLFSIPAINLPWIMIDWIFGEN